jgi:hypothetical protein
MVDKNDSLLREVDDELRRDQIKKLWDRYGTYVVGAMIAFVASVGLYQFVEQRRIAAAQTAGSAYEAARKLIVEKKTDAAAKALSDLSSSGPAGYAALARLQIAAAAAKSDKVPEAVAAYDAIVADSAADPVLSDLARLQAAALRLGTGDWTELQNRLTPLVDERNAFRAQARELLGLAAQAAKKPDEARRLFLQVLGDAKSSTGLKDRVTGYMASLVAADLAKPATATTTPPTPVPGDGKLDGSKSDAVKK